MDICARIRRARRRGNTRCGVVDGRKSFAEAARIFGLAEDDAIFRPIDRTEADEIAIYILHADLAYGSEIMARKRAAHLWQHFMELFRDQKVEFATNAGPQAGSWMSATKATFDMGVLVIGTTKTGCLWVEDED